MKTPLHLRPLMKPRIGVEEVAEALGKKPDTIRRLARKGKIPGARKIGQWSFDPDRINAFFAKAR